MPSFSHSCPEISSCFADIYTLFACYLIDVIAFFVVFYLFGVPVVLSFVCGFIAVLMCFLIALCVCSFMPLWYGYSVLFFFLHLCAFTFFFLDFIVLVCLFSFGDGPCWVLAAVCVVLLCVYPLVLR